jgi:predicted transcriptional regulator
MDMELFPGQKETHTFTLEQLECIASPARNEVFWTFRYDQPQSVAEVAAEIGKSAQTVHYQVASLLDVGLLMKVGERKRRSRMEALYVWPSVRFYSSGRGASKEYQQTIVTSFAANMRLKMREVEAFHEVADDDPELWDLVTFRQRFLRLSPERTQEFKQQFQRLLREPHPEEGPRTLRVHASVFLYPTQGGLKERINQSKLTEQ